MRKQPKHTKIQNIKRSIFFCLTDAYIPWFTQKSLDIETADAYIGDMSLFTAIAVSVSLKVGGSVYRGYSTVVTSRGIPGRHCAPSWPCIHLADDDGKTRTAIQPHTHTPVRFRNIISMRVVN